MSKRPEEFYLFTDCMGNVELRVKFKLENIPYLLKIVSMAEAMLKDDAQDAVEDAEPKGDAETATEDGDDVGYPHLSPEEKAAAQREWTGMMRGMVDNLPLPND